MWHAQLVVLCALVFVFALHAKTAVYNGGVRTNVTPSTASKLWLSGQKMEVQAADSASGVLFWVAALCLYGVYLHREARVRSAFLPPPPRILTERYMQSFLRPPPVQV